MGVGHRFLGDAPGVHCHNDGTQHKANGYMRWVPLCLDDVFWAAKFEVLVDRNHCAKVARKTDQWVQRARGVQLGALWVCGGSPRRCIMNVPPRDIEDTIGGFAHCNVFWTDDYDLLGKVMDVPTLTIRSDSAVAERWGIGEQELNNYVVYPSFIVTRGKFKDS